MLFFPLFRNDHLRHFQNVNKNTLLIKFIHTMRESIYHLFLMDLSSICGYVDTHSERRLEKLIPVLPIVRVIAMRSTIQLG